MSFTFLWYQFDSFFAFRDAFHTLQPLYQILIIAGLVALTVAIVALVYYILKYTFILIFEIIKAIFNLIRSLLEAIFGNGLHSHSEYRRSHRYYRRYSAAPMSPVAPAPPARPMPPAPPARPLPPRAPLAPNFPTAPNTIMPPISSLHCPMCGKSFTQEMSQLLSRNNKTFCEFCGHQLEYVMD